MHEVWEHPKVRLWELPGGPPAGPAGLAAADAYRFIVEAPFEAYAAKHGKPRWGDKTPHYVHHVDHLLRVWPRRPLRRARPRRARRRALAAAACRSARTTPGPRRSGGRAGSGPATAAQREHPGARADGPLRGPRAAARETRCRGCASSSGCATRDDMLALEQADPARIVRRPGVRGSRRCSTASTRAPSGAGEREMSARDQRIFAALAGAELARSATRSSRSRAAGITPRQERWFRYHNELMRNVNFLRLRLVQERGRELRFALARRLRDPASAAVSTAAR